MTNTYKFIIGKVQLTFVPHLLHSGPFWPIAIWEEHPSKDRLDCEFILSSTQGSDDGDKLVGKDLGMR